MIVTFLDVVLIATYFLLLFLSIFWLLVLFSKDEQTNKNKLKNHPFFTTIVPAYNEEKSIRETILSLINLDYPQDKREIIVVNDGSTDQTKQIVEQLITEYPQDNIILINQANGGKGKAMNSGLKVARGEFFACLDADSYVHPNALPEMLPLFQDQEVGAVCPLLKIKRPKNMLQKVQWTEYIINMFYRLLNAKLHCIHVTPGPFSIYRTKTIQDLGGYDEETITEDLELAIRLQKYHYKILQTFDAIVETTPPSTWKALFKQRVRWYKGSVDNTLQYKKLIFNKNYGDFGMVRMPTIIASGVIAIVLTFALVQALAIRLYYGFIALKDINFDIITLLKNYSPTINLLNLPYFRLAIALTLIILSLFVMYKSFQLVKEKITRYGRTWLSVTTYLLVYSLFLTTVWVYIAYMFIRKKKNFWS
ncbi:MAG: glycosyltransferase [Nanoarchaeota archaeon]|nr:glycosyltransferase [Nanoarchaeota archaeon]MBU1623113.1 glycosyltransferase [Nanoarchaeota archaeon]MBU1973931.1 glycosyltransferase [Nanoarchaeota archaeon]